MNPSFNTADMRLHIAFAKIRLTDNERAAAEDLARQVQDWDGFIETAVRNFSLPNMRMHLANMDPGCVPAEVHAQLKTAANAFAMRNMLLISAQRAFKERCIDPLGETAIFFKGITLVGQYYPDLGLRPCRDIDVLVRPGSLRPIVLHAIKAGYRFVVAGQADHPLTEPSEIEAALHYRNDATLLSPEGMAIDMQVKLDKFSGIFAETDVFGQATPISLGGTEFLTMPPAFLFNYICHHHARHVWSRLHWLSDLDAMVSAPVFDEAATLALADRLNQRGTVEASLEMQRLMSPTANWADAPESWRGQKFLELSLRNLAGDLELEKRIGFTMKGGEFMFDWQADPALIRRARWRQWRRMLQPTIRQYTRFPLPRGLRWLYVFPRFVHLMERTRDRTGKEAE
ncbi:nucleotidyltransferase family protein [uncultured Roseobacter sp.]|uniref:nucleotidyltransferase family protein n=1 Tax=uncultured Roseobacter sp. TaxID=114847 RepID=UPI0026048AFD|nr:nucleotidyltransferase family protein [uncultured Roseobacter sp.]